MASQGRWLRARINWRGANHPVSGPNNPAGKASNWGARLERPEIGVPQVGQNVRVKVAPEAAVTSKPRVSPTTLAAPASTRNSAEWPLPVARWQSRQAHISMERTWPATVTVTAPQAQRAVRSTAGWRPVIR